MNGSIKITLKTLSRESFEYYAIKIKDTGLGIKPEDLSKLGTEFTMLQTHSSVNPNGTGLGLYMCKQILSLLKGELRITSIFGRGSTFLIILPLEQKVEEEKSVSELLSDPENTSISPAIQKIEVFPIKQSKTKVLIVDDSSMNLFVLQCLFERFGISVDKGKDGYEAVAKVKSYFNSFNQTYSLILMDINMPGMGGFEAGRLIKEMEANKKISHTPIIALSGESSEEIPPIILHQSFDSILMKPLSGEKLKQVLLEYSILGS